MKNDEENEGKKLSRRSIAGLLAVAVLILFWGVMGKFGLLSKFDFRVYDIMLLLHKAPKECDEVMLVDIDDLALEHMGEWPWTRDKIADSLMMMRELGAKTAVFDIEYLSPSQKSVNQDILNQIRQSPQQNGAKIDQLFKDNDAYFGSAVQFFGNTWLTINAGDLNIRYEDEDIGYAAKRFLYDFSDESGWFDKIQNHKSYREFSPALQTLITRARGAGFTNVKIDADGTRRRIKPLIAYDDGALGQLATAPLLKIIQPEKIELRKRLLVLHDCTFPGETEKQTVRIPLDDEGYMLINWLKKPFSATKTVTDADGNTSEEIDEDRTSFKHCSVFFLWNLRQLENDIIAGLRALDTLEDFDLTDESGAPLAYRSEYKELVSDYNEIEEFRTYILDCLKGYDAVGKAIEGGVSDETYAQYFELRQRFFENAYFFTAGDAFQELAEFTAESAEFSALVQELALDAEDFAYYYQELQEKFKDKFCIIGNTGSGTTDLGSTPFHNGYPNVGTHANVYNTIMNRSFITPVGWHWGFIAAALLSIAVFGFHSKRSVLLQNLLGGGLLFIVLGVPVLLMACASIYIPVVASTMLVLSCYIIITAIRFRSSEKDKKFIQATFGSYVSPAYVDLIVKNPEKYAALGGENKYLTALFSDVKTFSGFTEVINNEAGEEQGAARLVDVLNKYLGVLSDAILEARGTIDKYVGDEIVSFFGAPIPSENNAFDACVAAIRMLQAEKKFNEEYKDELPINPRTGEPFYLHSRVGLNTGKMVVGNMGTEGKLNYTVMGNNVNLASRLEGTNKEYGSWIMCSESTWQKANSGANEGKLVARKFDYVRVVNVNRPVGIYNILGLKDELPEKQIQAADLFNKGMKWYLHGADTPNAPKDAEDLKKAYAFFKQADELFPEDESSKTFMKRCSDFVKNGLPEVWDGVFTMATK